ncbi:MAG: hypothetical protein AB7U18_25735 [Dehalococcoidia bacterium]
MNLRRQGVPPFGFVLRTQLHRVRSDASDSRRLAARSSDARDPGARHNLPHQLQVLDTGGAERCVSGFP